jgi:DNA uptake protein ComE-like DNA-binding protein
LGLSCFTAGSIRLSSTAASNRPPVTIDINRADSALLARLPGITPALAERIVRHRQLYGPFKRTRDICRIRGIGYRHFTAVAARLAVDGAGNDALPLREKGKSG